jgi:hypothetical protein
MVAIVLYENEVNGGQDKTKGGGCGDGSNFYETIA